MDKKLIFSIFLILAGLIVTNAQITEGNWMLGGDTYFKSSKNYNENNTINTNEFRINPNLGYFFTDNLVGGIQVNISFTNTNPGNDSTRNHFYGFAPFARYYFLDSHKIINLFTEASYQFQYAKNPSYDRLRYRAYSLKAGTVLFLNNSVGLEFSLNYTNRSSKTDDLKIKSFFIGFGFQIHLEPK